jgi:hypothetical protein
LLDLKNLDPNGKAGRAQRGIDRRSFRAAPLIKQRHQW